LLFLDLYNGTAVGAGGIILRTTNGGATFVEDENNFTQPKDFLLEQNYPNPFNPVTKINFTISEFSFTTLKVYDLLGREITTLVNEEKPAGEYEVEFNAANLLPNGSLTSGIYFYQLRAGEYVETKKMILLR